MIRLVRPEDVPALVTLINSTDMFPGEMLPDMIAPYFAAPEAGDALWWVDDAGPRAVAYCARERMTNNAWNLLMIAVHGLHQGHGIGSALLRHVESEIAARDARIVLADTSGQASYARTRQFYRNAGYTEEARIRDFWDTGDDKVTFTKTLAKE